MPEYNNKATSLNFSFRRFLVVLLVPIVFIFCFNGVEVEVVSNAHADFHQYSENSVSPGTSYYDDGAVQPFASAWNSLAKNIARMLGYTHLISDNTNTTNSYIATLYTYLSNNLPGQWATLSDIKTASVNSAASLSALLTLTGDQANIDWVNTNIVSTVSISTSFNQSNPIYPNTSNALSPGTYYLRLPNFPYDTSNFDTNLFRFDIPVRTQWTSLFNKNWITDISVLVDNANTVYQGDYYWDIDVMKNGQYYLRFYFLDFVPYHNNSLVIKFTTTDTWLYTSDDTKYVWYIPSSSPDYLAFNDYVNLKRIQSKDFTAEIDGSEINVNINDSVNVTPIELDVQIGINDFTEVNTISNKLRTWLSTGVGVSALIGALDQLDDSFFTLHNRSVIETINAGYTDFYD